MKKTATLIKEFILSLRNLKIGIFLYILCPCDKISKEMLECKYGARAFY